MRSPPTLPPPKFGMCTLCQLCTIFNQKLITCIIRSQVVVKRVISRKKLADFILWSNFYHKNMDVSGIRGQFIQAFIP